MRVWVEFAANRIAPIEFIQGHLHSELYVDMLAEHLLPEEPLITGGDYLFQQDNASCHVSCTAYGSRSIL